MRITTVPSWVRLSRQEQLIFDVLYSEPLHVAVYSRIFEKTLIALPSISRPRLSDLLSALEVKGVVSRGQFRGNWKVNAETLKKLVAQSASNAKVRKGKK